MLGFARVGPLHEGNILNVNSECSLDSSCQVKGIMGWIIFMFSGSLNMSSLMAMKATKWSGRLSCCRLCLSQFIVKILACQAMTEQWWWSKVKSSSTLSFNIVQRATAQRCEWALAARHKQVVRAGRRPYVCYSFQSTSKTSNCVQTRSTVHWLGLDSISSRPPLIIRSIAPFSRRRGRQELRVAADDRAEQNRRQSVWWRQLVT